MGSQRMILSSIVSDFLVKEGVFKFVFQTQLKMNIFRTHIWCLHWIQDLPYMIHSIQYIQYLCSIWYISDSDIWYIWFHILTIFHLVPPLDVFVFGIFSFELFVFDFYVFEIFVSDISVLEIFVFDIFVFSPFPIWCHHWI